PSKISLPRMFRRSGSTSRFGDLSAIRSANRFWHLGVRSCESSKEPRGGDCSQREGAVGRTVWVGAPKERRSLLCRSSDLLFHTTLKPALTDLAGGLFMSALRALLDFFIASEDVSTCG